MKKGDKIPDISFRTRSLGEWKNWRRIPRNSGCD